MRFTLSSLAVLSMFLGLGSLSGCSSNKGNIKPEQQAQAEPAQAAQNQPSYTQNYQQAGALPPEIANAMNQEANADGCSCSCRVHPPKTQAQAPETQPQPPQG